MRYYVTGATGFIGGVIARKLIARGDTVVVPARSPEKAVALAALGAVIHKGDVTDKESLRQGMTGVDGVFHVAGWYKVGVKDTTMAQAINVDGTRNVLELMRELPIARGVYTSTLAVNSDTGGREVDETYHFRGAHLSEYDRTKAAAHAVAEALIDGGLPVVIVMPGMVYGADDQGPAATTFRQYLTRRLPILPQKAAYSWGHVDDIADAHILAMDKGRLGEKYIICGPSHTLIEAMEMAQRITGIPAPSLRLPPLLMRLSAALMTPLAAIADLPETFHPEMLRVSAGVTYLGNNAKARRELGYSPRPLEQGLREYLAHEMRQMGMTPPV